MLFTPDHYHLLPAAVQVRADVHDLVQRVELTVIDHFTEDGTVQLDGYDPDPIECDPDLLVRLRYAIADVVEHVASRPEAHVQSQTRGDRSVTYREALQSMPRGWDRLLVPYDMRTPDPLFRV